MSNQSVIVAGKCVVLGRVVGQKQARLSRAESAGPEKKGIRYAPGLEIGRALLSDQAGISAAFITTYYRNALLGSFFQEIP